MRGYKFFCEMCLLVALSAIVLISGCGSSSSSDRPSPPDTTAPTAPTYLTAVAASSTKVSLRWAASADSVGVTAYAINRDGALLATTTTATTVYSDTSCTAATTYSYSVTALDNANNVSLPSSIATTTTIAAGLADGDAPTVPGGLSATVISSSQISLTWVISTDVVGVSGYNIYRGTGSCASKVMIGTATTNSYTDTGLTEKTLYCYVVKAFDGVPHESDASNEVSKTTQ